MRWLVVVLVGAALFCGRSLAEECPWINAATVSAILDESVTAVYKPSKNRNGDGRCLFTGEENRKNRLSVDVRTTGTAGNGLDRERRRCGGKSKNLKATGNEAFVCPVAAHGGSEAIVLAGRVREKVFVIELRTRKPDLTPAAMQRKAEDAAGQVSGNLF